MNGKAIKQWLFNIIQGALIWPTMIIKIRWIKKQNPGLQGVAEDRILMLR